MTKITCTDLLMTKITDLLMTENTDLLVHNGLCELTQTAVICVYLTMWMAGILGGNLISYYTQVCCSKWSVCWLGGIMADQMDKKLA